MITMDQRILGGEATTTKIDQSVYRVSYKDIFESNPQNEKKNREINGSSCRR